MFVSCRFPMRSIISFDWVRPAILAGDLACASNFFTVNGAFCTSSRSLTKRICLSHTKFKVAPISSESVSNR